MSENILIREVDKEIENIGYSDVVFFGNDDLYHAVLDELKSYSNHFPEIALQKFSSTDQSLITTCIQKGAIVIEIGHENISVYELGGGFKISNTIAHSHENLSHLGFQRHLCHAEQLRHSDNLLNESFSLGKLNFNPNEIEPVTRDAYFLSVDLSALSSVLVKNVKSAKATGMNETLLLQIIKNCSHSSNLKYLNFITANIEGQNLKTEKEIIASSIWYFLEGLKQGQYRPNESDEKYYVTVEEFSDALIFTHSADFNKWWVNLENEEDKIPCSAEEYQQTIEGNLPDRLMRRLTW